MVSSRVRTSARPRPTSPLPTQTDARLRVPVNADIGQLDVSFVDEDDKFVNPIGVKGIGEIGITGVAAALANAVYNATGVRVRDLPITLDKVIAGMKGVA